tara:strand:+ start:844 stop:1491 length:648 start_codon:yes stop_codon:yes gene_type:complete
MSSIKLKHSGGNSVSLNPPTSAPTSSEVAFKLPNADGSAGQVLRTDGSGNLSWVDDQKGKILQVVQTVENERRSNVTTQNSYWTQSTLNTSITPSATSSKVLIEAVFPVGISVNSRHVYAAIYRDSTQIGQSTSSGNNIIEMTSGVFLPNDFTVDTLNIKFLDSPSTTSATTYSFRFYHSQTGTATIYLNRSGSVSDRAEDAYFISTVTLSEVAA